MRHVRLATLVLVAWIVLYGAYPPSAFAQDWLGFRGSLGHERLGGDLAVPMSGDTRTEWTVMLLLPPSQSFQVRFGAGMGRVTYDLQPTWRTQSLTETAVHVELDPPPYERWNHVTWHFAVGIELLSTPCLDVYVEHRLVRGRLRSQTQQLVPSSDHPPRQTPYDEWGTSSSEVVLGIKSDLWGRLPFDFDLLLRRGEIRPRNASSWDLTSHALGVRKGGSATGIQFGVFWHP